MTHLSGGAVCTYAHICLHLLKFSYYQENSLLVAKKAKSWLSKRVRNLSNEASISHPHFLLATRAPITPFPHREHVWKATTYWSVDATNVISTGFMAVLKMYTDWMLQWGCIVSYSKVFLMSLRCNKMAFEITLCSDISSFTSKSTALKDFVALVWSTNASVPSQANSRCSMLPCVPWVRVTCAYLRVQKCILSWSACLTWHKWHLASTCPGRSSRSFGAFTTGFM